MKYTVALLRNDMSTVFTTWPAYAAVAVGAGAIVLNQAAYQAGPLAGALPAIVITDSTVAIIVSAAAFHEEIGTSPLSITFEVIGFATMALAIVALARQASGRDSRSPTAALSAT